MATNGANGSSATPDRETILREAAYFAASAGYFDTSQGAQQSGELTISIMEVGIDPCHQAQPINFM